MKTTIFIILLFLTLFVRGQTKSDTIPALLLISDTTHFPVQMVSVDSTNKRMIITEDRQDERTSWINGFVIYSNHLEYLNNHKKKLEKNIVVWTFKLKTHDN